MYVNGVVTFRVREPELLASRVDFSINTRTGRYQSEPLDKLAVVVKELAQELAGAFVARVALRALLDQSSDVMRQEIQRGLVAAPNLSSLGLEIVATRVASIKPTAEVDKALQMPARERIAEAADGATFSRRALAINKERAIAENELANQIELARREEQLIAQRAQNEKKRITDDTSNKRIDAEAAALNLRLNAEAQAESTRLLEGACVQAERKRMEIYRALPPEALLGLAARELAGKLKFDRAPQHHPRPPRVAPRTRPRRAGPSSREQMSTPGARALPPRVVVLFRPSERDELVLRHGTLQQARFFAESRGQSIDDALHDIASSMLHCTP